MREFMGLLLLAGIFVALVRIGDALVMIGDKIKEKGN